LRAINSSLLTTAMDSHTTGQAARVFLLSPRAGENVPSATGTDRRKQSGRLRLEPPAVA